MQVRWWYDLLVGLATERPEATLGIVIGVLAVALLPWLSCRMDRSGRFTVSGRVTFAGRPVPNGRIVFEPDAKAGVRGPAAYAEITRGFYRTEAGKGAVAGRHAVRIAGFEGTIDRERMDAAMLFPEFMTAVELPARSSRQDFAVPDAQGPP